VNRYQEVVQKYANSDSATVAQDRLKQLASRE
jgi:hypothetical protein